MFLVTGSKLTSWYRTSLRRIGYCESWATTPPRDSFTPEDLELAVITHTHTHTYMALGRRLIFQPCNQYPKHSGLPSVTWSGKLLNANQQAFIADAQLALFCVVHLLICGSRGR